MKRILIYFFSLLTVITSFTFTVSAQKTYVVAVGLGNYKYPELAPTLPCSEADVRAVSNFFHNYNNSSVFMLINSNATRKHILKVLNDEFSKSGPNDEIIFIYSGHGVQGGLTCYETSDYNSLITYNEIQDIMKKAKARRKIILAMACYSGGLNIPDNSGSKYKKTTDKTSVMIYTSCRPEEVSWESSGMRNSFFMNRLLEGLRGGADKNGDKKVTARELFNYVNPKVIADTYGRQHPQMWGSFDDSMVVVYTK